MEEPPQKAMLEARFDGLEAQIQKIYSQEEMKSKNPPLAIRLWRKLRHKRNNLSEAELAELEAALPGKKAFRKEVTEMPLEPQPIEEEEEEDPRDAIAERWLGPLDQHTYRGQTSCQRGSMLAAYLIGKGIIASESEVSIGHQQGSSAEDKRFVAIIRGKKYLIFTAQHPGEDYKEYRVSGCWITQSMGYGIDLTGKKIRIGNRGFELNNGKTLV